MPRTLLPLLLLLGTIVTACSPRLPPLADTADSPEALARAVLAAVNAGDRQTLDRLAISESEFRDHIWPELPAARPERNLPFSFVWGDLSQKSTASLSRTLGALRGQPLELVEVRFGEVTRYATYAVHRDSVFVVRRPDGTTEDLRACGSFLEQRGRWKVFSYVTN